MDLGEIDEATTSIISWNRRSALSARSVLLHATNLFGRLDEAVIVFSPTPDTSTFHESSIVGIEDRIDAEVKGYLYILRETVAALVKQGRGSIALVVHQTETDFRSPLESAATGAFVALADSVSRFYQNEPVDLYQFRSQSDDVQGFARHVCDAITAQSRQRRRPGRWFEYPSGRLRRMARQFR